MANDVTRTAKTMAVAKLTQYTRWNNNENNNNNYNNNSNKIIMIMFISVHLSISLSVSLFTSCLSSDAIINEF